MAGRSTRARKEVLDIGVVIAGAGARGAYEAGLLAHLLPGIAGRAQAGGQVARFWFIGTSAGALNSVLIASRAPRVLSSHSPQQAQAMWTAVMDEVTGIWSGMSEARILAPYPNGRLLGAVSRLVPGVHVAVPSLLNVDPLEELANDQTVVDWDQMHQRVLDGTVGAVAAAVTGRDGRTVIFWDRHMGSEPLPRDDRRDIDYVDVPEGLSAQHVLASSAIPCLFPAQRIDDPKKWAGWYYDGGVRLNTPIKPALQLGLDHLVIVGTHPDRYERAELPDADRPIPEVDEAGVPIANQLMADQVIQDLQTLRGRNSQSGAELIRHIFAGPPGFDTLSELSRETPTGRSAARLLRRLLAGPARYEMSSYLLFDPGYLGASVAAGRERASHPEILPDGDEVPWRL